MAFSGELHLHALSGPVPAPCCGWSYFRSGCDILRPVHDTRTFLNEGCLLLLIGGAKQTRVKGIGLSGVRPIPALELEQEV